MRHALQSSRWVGKIASVNLTRAARRAERLPMSKLVEIEAKVSASRRSVRVGIDSGADAHMFVSAGAMGMSASFHAHTPAEAREYAQMLRGAADALLDWALLDWALQQEQPQNFAPPDPATRALNAGLDLLKQAGVGK